MGRPVSRDYLAGRCFLDRRTIRIEDTYDEAVAAARDAIEFHLACLEAEGEPIPEEGASPQLVSIAVA